MIERPEGWWWSPEYDKTPPMLFPDRRSESKFVKLPDDTDSEAPDLVIYTSRLPWSLRRP